MRKPEIAEQWLGAMIDHAVGRAVPERATVAVKSHGTNPIKVFGSYSVRYGNNLSGPTRISIRSFRGLLTTRPRVGSDAGIISSRSLSLLLGELFQGAVQRLLPQMHIGGVRVQSLADLSPATHAKGRRIDDWLITLTDGSKMPVEVKSSARCGYFRNAYAQITNALATCPRAIFVGILHPMHRILVIECTAPLTAARFWRDVSEVNRR